MINLLTWNVAGRTRLLRDQAAAVARREPDVVALQEIRPSTVGPWREALAAEGLAYAADSAASREGRRLFNLTASRYPLHSLSPFAGPRPERLLSVLLEAPPGELEVHNVHVPPAPSNGLVKVEFCEAVYGRLARPSTRQRIFCGDLNLPRSEAGEGEIETFARNHPDHAERWDAAERSLIEGLREWDLADCFRALHGYDRQDSSWVLHTRGRKKAAFRLDHVLASAGLNVLRCDYIHEWREAGLSDHSAMEAAFDPPYS